jgi:hypothetical protein
VRVMVTGGRDWTDRKAIWLQLNTVKAPDVTLVVGDCPTGADAIAIQLCPALGWGLEQYFADWNGRGKKAGPERNQRMVDSKPDLVFAFPTERSKGTWDAVRRARAAGIEVNVWQ